MSLYRIFLIADDHHFIGGRSQKHEGSRFLGSPLHRLRSLRDSDEFRSKLGLRSQSRKRLFTVRHFIFTVLVRQFCFAVIVRQFTVQLFVIPTFPFAVLVRPFILLDILLAKCL